MLNYNTLLFYKYTRIENAEKYAEQHLKYCLSLGLKGRVLVADEGINGSVSGPPQQCEQYMAYLQDDQRFAGIEFKIEATDELSFNKMHVRYRKEIVHFGIEINPDLAGIRLSGQEVLAMKDSPDVVMVDMRNDIECQVGKFKNALTLDMHTFRELPQKMEALLPYKDKKIIAYCTGGIRCEKATAYLIQQGFPRENVFHIDGGIIKYAQHTGGVDFDGKCYVFDKRLVTDVNSVNPTIISHCEICQQPSAHLVNCANAVCNKHFVLCESCGEKLEGCCSEDCRQSISKRDYDGTGYYARNGKQIYHLQE